MNTTKCGDLRTVEQNSALRLQCCISVPSVRRTMGFFVSFVVGASIGVALMFGLAYFQKKRSIARVQRVRGRGQR